MHCRKIVGIGLFMAEYLNDDPHPSVQQLAHNLQVRNIGDDEQSNEELITKEMPKLEEEQQL